MPWRHNGIDKRTAGEHNCEVMDVFVITRQQPKPMRYGNTWHFRADGFYLMPAGKTEPLTGVQVDELVSKWTQVKPQEAVGAGWLVRASGNPWHDPELVSALHSALRDGPAVLAARLRPVPTRRQGLLARVAAAWAALSGGTVNGQTQVQRAHRDAEAGA
jgi:hypothetical protein